MSSRTLLTNTLWRFFDGFLDLIVATVISIWSAHVLGPSKLGPLSFVFWIATMASTLSTLGVPAATTRFVAEHLGAGRRPAALSVVRAALRFSLLTAVAVTLLALLVTFIATPRGELLFTIFAVLSIFPAMLNGIPSAFNAACEDFAANIKPSVLSTLLRLVGTGAVLWTGGSLVGLTLVFLLARIVDAWIRNRTFLRRYGSELASAPALDPLVRSQLIRYCGESTKLLLLSLTVWDRSEMLFLRAFSTNEQIAFFSLSWGIIRSLQGLPQSFAGAAGVRLMLRHGENPKTVGKLTSDVVRFMAFVVFPMSIGLAVLAGPTVRLLYGERYLAAIPVLTIMALCCVPQLMLLPATMLLSAGDQQSFMVRWGLVAAVVTLIADYFLIRAWGANGAALANGIGQAFAAAGIWFFAARRHNVRAPVRDLTLIALASVAMGAVALTVSVSLPPWAGVAAGVSTGMGAYVLLIGVLRCLRYEDRSRLLTAGRAFPIWLQKSYNRVVLMLVPTA